MVDSYTALLEKTRVPQPSFQKFAVISIFSKLRSASKRFDSESEPGRAAISHCLHSSDLAVVDQSVRELCRLVIDSKMDISTALLELQSAIEGAHSRFTDVFVKGLGFLVRFEFQKNNGLWRFSSTEMHPFVKVLSCRSEVQSELVRQVLLFIAQNRQLGMVEVCEFLRPFLHFSILWIPFSDSSASFFLRDLVSAMVSLCCSFPFEALPILKLFIGCLKYFPLENSKEIGNLRYFVECNVDTYIMVLRQTVGKRPHLITEAQLWGVQLLEAVFSVITCLYGNSGGIEPIVELVEHLLTVQKDFGLHYIPELSSVILSLFVMLIQSEFEHEQLCVLKLLLFLLKWKVENDSEVTRTECALNEELLFLFPVINLMSSPSIAVKGAATDLLVMLEKLLVKLVLATKNARALEREITSVSKPESIMYRLLQHTWFQDQYSSASLFFLTSASNGKTGSKEKQGLPRSWSSELTTYFQWIVDRRKSTLPISQSLEFFATEMPLLLTAIAGLLVMHDSLWSNAIDALTAIGVMNPKLGVPLLLAVLFYNNIFSRKDTLRHDMPLKLLGMLPSLASHSGMMPLVVQTILPMLHKDSNPVLYATATRLLCQTWETNDRAFRTLQGVLHPKSFAEFPSERNVCISMAASIRDVCKTNPDRGVDLILSVSACIESRDPIIQALGFQSLSHLCEADVIDFYTAWDVIAKHVLDYSMDPALAYSLCLLLRWAAMDAEAYSEASRNVLQILWGIGTSTLPCHELMAKARASAFEALTQFEVSHIEDNIPDFKNRNIKLFLSETNSEVLSAMEGFQIKIITYEHINRRRLVKEKRVTASKKIDKLLDVFPQVTFSSGKSTAGELPGAALFCISFTPKDVNNTGAPLRLRDVHAAYQNALMELASSLQLSRNTFIAILSLQSWKDFMSRWMKANISFIDAKTSSIVLDKTSKAANDILKSIMQAAEESIPKCAENIALAIGSLCVVLPPSVHAVKATASKFLLKWLFQYEHEHRQWSAAISLGLISSCLHVTDHKQKFQIISGLIEVLCGSKSTLVRGASGVGLGFSCQDLLTRVEIANNSDLEKETYKVQEVDLLGKIVRALSLVLCQLSPSSKDILESLSACFSSGINDVDTSINSESSHENCDDLEEDIWGVAGLIIGLGSSVGAIYRAGGNDAVCKIKGIIMSWVPHVNSLVQYSGSCSERSEIVLAVGSCLALPFVLAFCHKVELVSGNELDYIVNGYGDLISELVSLRKPGTIHQNLLMASCTGAGNLVASILNEGVHSIEVDCIKRLLDLFRKCYTNPYPPIIHLGGMLGVVNAMGAGAGVLVHFRPITSMQTGYVHKESSYILGPLLSNPVCEPLLTSLVQDMFLVAQNFDDYQLQEYAAWAIAFLHHSWSRKLLHVDSGIQTGIGSSESNVHRFSEDSVLMKLCLWLMHLNYSGTGENVHVGTVVSVLKCLSRAPRLPSMDWGAIIRRCMRYEAQVSEVLPLDSVFKKGILREECLQFSLAHASQFDPLLTFLDELSDLSRFRTLEVNLQSCLLFHLANLIKLFSGARIEKLFDDMTNYMSSFASHKLSPDQKSLLRISCWKGISQCLDQASLDSLDYICNIERCMEVIFSSLLALHSVVTPEVDQVHSVEEWSEAVQCLGRARKGWLLDFLQVFEGDLVRKEDHFIEVVKKIQAKARLVRSGSLPMTELGKLKAYILNSESLGVWGVLIEVVAALQQADGSVRRQWLIDAVEISCISSYPSTVLQFLGLLSGSCCKYMPLLIIDRYAVLSDLPVTLTSLLSDPNWEAIAEPVISYLWTLMERIYYWATCLTQGDDTPSVQPIDRSENVMVSFLLPVVHHICVRLKDYLPLDKQLRLSNMIIA